MGLGIGWSLRGVGLIAAVICLVSSGRVALASDSVSFQDVEESLTCQCGCGLTVHSCNHLQCDSALPLRAEIRAQMDQGKNKEAILAYFAGKYGEKILSAPTTTGFNLVAWVMPFVLVAVAAVFVGGAVIRWGGRRGGSPPQPAAPAAHAHSEHEKTFEKELKNFDA